MYSPGNFNELPVVVKNLLIINGLLFLATISLSNYGIDLVKIFGLHQFQSNDFRPHQIITHLFMHGSFTHLFFNMFALWMFGKILENIWGQKKILTYYMITGIGAAAIHLIFCQYQIINISNQIPDLVNIAIEGKYNPSLPLSKKLTQLIITPTVGASGAVFGLLLAFGMLFPNSQIRIFSFFLVILGIQFYEWIFPSSIIINYISNNIFSFIIVFLILSNFIPEARRYILHTIPIKAKYFVIGYGLIELYLGISNNPADNVAHFAHLGGMIFGYFLINYWKKNTTSF